MRTLTLALLSFVLSVPALATVDNPDGIYVGDIPPVHDIESSKATFEARKQKVVDLFSSLTQVPVQNGGVSFWLTGLSKLYTGIDAKSVNDAFLVPSAVPYSNSGTDFHDLKPFCQRNGDYDFFLRGLVDMYYYFGNNPALISPAARQVMLYTLMNQIGNQPHLQNNFGICGTFPETENHILQTEVSRYLTNQARFKDQAAQGNYVWDYDNEANGMNAWMLLHFQQFFQNNFSEYNSHPYQAYAIMAVHTLYEFADDPRVKLAAEMTLNYLDAMFASSSNGLRHFTPFRRQPAYEGRTDLFNFDDETQRFFQLAGNLEKVKYNPIPNWLEAGYDRMLGFALGKYRTPDMILDMILDKSKGAYFERYTHTGLELYASSPSFLISAGGIYITKWDFFSNTLNGWPVSTTLMPTKGGIDASEYISIDGHTDPTQRINTCIAPGFACGLNPDISQFIPEQCITRKYDDWAFVDFTSPNCPLHYGFYAAVYTQNCDTKACTSGGGTFGFFEAAEPRPDLTFDQFRTRILKFNKRRIFHSGSENVYVTSDERHIHFIPMPSNKWNWGIRAIDNQKFDVNMARWPLAQGEIVQADRSGLVVIHNPYMHRRLVLDMRDALHPRRSEEVE